MPKQLLYALRSTNLPMLYIWGFTVENKQVFILLKGSNKCAYIPFSPMSSWGKAGVLWGVGFKVDSLWGSGIMKKIEMQSDVYMEICCEDKEHVSLSTWDSQSLLYYRVAVKGQHITTEQ